MVRLQFAKSKLPWRLPAVINHTPDPGLNPCHPSASANFTPGLLRNTALFTRRQYCDYSAIVYIRISRLHSAAPLEITAQVCHAVERMPRRKQSLLRRHGTLGQEPAGPPCGRIRSDRHVRLSPPFYFSVFLMHYRSLLAWVVTVFALLVIHEQTLLAYVCLVTVATIYGWSNAFLGILLG